MADKNQYQTLLRAKIKSAIEEARAASVLTHQGVKGAVLEILIGKLFKPLLPSDIGVGTGQIIDSFNTPMSGQIDIILYDKSILPPALIDDKTGLFPIESVLYTIEIKTTLNATELATAHESAKKIARFKYLSGLRDDFGKEVNHSVEYARSVIFALGSDLSGTRLNEAQRYKNFYKEETAHLRAICIAGREYCYDNGEHWISFKHDEEYDEVLAFIGGVTNTYKNVSKSRLNPLLGYYVVPETQSPPSIIESRKVAKIKVTCNKCGTESLFKPNIGKQNLVINGAIIYSDPCAVCGGEMKSVEGTYQFIQGELIENKA